MYGKFLYLLGLAFTLFIVVMFISYLFRSGFSGILKFFFSRLLIISFVITVCLIAGIGIYSAINGTDPMETLLYLKEMVQKELSFL
ncbi:MAG: hypothetical protein EH225_10680 [Calditrichaeota bacterium]|nr:hypothetical protein [Calditrichota bacterium]RQW00052.1 MAG: hypothetical protein EH225_10680 [Calditrichota bacterium]